jgi:Tol biopolymer transport system component
MRFAPILVPLCLLATGACTAEPTAPATGPAEYDLLFSGYLVENEQPVLFRVGLDGLDPRPIAGPITGYQPSAAPDGSAITYHRFDEASGESTLMVLRPGSGPRPLAGVPAALNREAAWSPDGTRLLFISHVDDPYGDLFVADLSGETLTRVTNLTPSAGPDVTGMWSPDGQRIAFTSYRSNYPSVWTMTSGGADLKQVTFGGTQYGDYFPSWSPDGASLVFQRIGATTSAIGVISANGGGPLFFELAGRNYSPRWSPDGRHIAIATDDGDIRVLDAAGKLIRRIERAGTDRSPSWIRKDSPLR